VGPVSHIHTKILRALSLKKCLPDCQALITCLGGAESFNDDSAQGLCAAEALDRVEYFYAGSLSVRVINPPDVALLTPTLTPVTV
jgi:hypothetical protein